VSAFQPFLKIKGAAAPKRLLALRGLALSRFHAEQMCVAAQQQATVGKRACYPQLIDDSPNGALDHASSSQILATCVILPAEKNFLHLFWHPAPATG
jgi:hypothetical protein